jgi:hypothetical protein
MTDSPLSEAKVESLDELMSRFPPSKDDLDKIILHLREGRKQWQKDESEGRTRARPVTTGLSLKDLGLA